MKHFTFYVNGQAVEAKGNQLPEKTLLEYLREDLGLIGTKLGCGEGGCGACTVMLSRRDPSSGKIVHLAVNACLLPVCEAANSHVTTIEGIGSSRTKLHALQQAMVDGHGSQCGFCTPGIIMSAYALYRNTNGKATRDQLDEALEGNLCRCTGYRAILSALAPVLTGFGADLENVGDSGVTCGPAECSATSTVGGCCGGAAANGGVCCKSLTSSQPKTLVKHNAEGQTHGDDFIPKHETQQPIFPPALSLQSHGDAELCVTGSAVTWYRPTSLARVFELLQKHPQARMVAGNSEVGIEHRHDRKRHQALISLTYVRELLVAYEDDGAIFIGSSTTYTNIREQLTKLCASLPEHQTRTFSAINACLRFFAGLQVRNVAVLGGNLATASPISDLNPILMAGRCSIVLRSATGARVVPASDFFTGYRKTCLETNEVIVGVRIPFTQPNEYIEYYMQSRRRDDDIAIVVASLSVQLNHDDTISRAIFAYGGAAAMTKIATRTCDALVGRPFTAEAIMPIAQQHLPVDLPIPDAAPGGMGAFREALCISFVQKFVISTLLLMKKPVADCDRSAGLPRPHLVTMGLPKWVNASASSVEYEGAPLMNTLADGKTAAEAAGGRQVGTPLPHLSAHLQVTGEAKYTDDMPRRDRELAAALVVSDRAHATIKSIDASQIMKVPGVHSFIGAHDVPGLNSWGAVIKDEEPIFAFDKVQCCGQVIGMVLADTHQLAKEGARLVKIEYEDLPSILSIEEAIKAESFYSLFGMSKLELKRGADAEEALSNAPHMLEGEVHMGGQEHFYLETQATLALPSGEDGNMEIFCSSQSPTSTQNGVARVLGVPAHKVLCRVKRLGGGFGGKETRNVPLSAATAVAAQVTQRPVRLTLDRDMDMAVTGQRHPFHGRYRVGFDDNGHVVALILDIYSNGGWSLDLSWSVMERALFSFDNCYSLPSVHVTGRVCKTNLPSFTAFRGFGAPQGMFICESIFTQIARSLNRDPTELRMAHFYQEGEQTPFGMALERFRIPEVVSSLMSTCDFEKRKAAVAEFNAANRYRKRGIAFIPTKFGISFTAKFLNQAGALLQVYTDGSILLTHGGTEMGQGLHTKIVQIAADALGVPVSQVFINETSTATVPNTSPTAASTGSDLNGMAVLDACQIINARLAKYRLAQPEATFQQLVAAAYMDRTSLSTTGFYATPNIEFDWKVGKGRPFNYFSFGASVAEVEIDCLTGDHQVLRADVVMDVGKSLNPAVDMGQVEGGYVQGYGLFLLEESTYLSNGRMFSRGPGAYKIPSFSSIPADFRVTLLPNAPNPLAVHSSKAVGEPPLFLAAAVFFAVEDAIHAYRLDHGLAGRFRLDSPASCERIRLACEDEITKGRDPKKSEPDVRKRWNVVV